MATYDNKHWLLSHIRNSFISTDDTGMCEIVMLGEDLPKLLRYRNNPNPTNKRHEQNADIEEMSEEEYEERVSEFDCYPEMDQSDDDDMGSMAESCDLQREMNFISHRQRSNTAQKLEKMEQANRKAARIKMVKWENPSSCLTDQERSELFAKREIKLKDPNLKDQTKKKSLLTDQLEKCPYLPQTQYLEYAKFDGTAQLGLPIKSYKIFMTMLPEDQRNYPIMIRIIAKAKIQDLIGFTCYKYSIAHPEVNLGPVSNYGLFMTEDNGEVDWEFPCLDVKEACSKFGLDCLGLVDLKSCNNRPSEVPTSSIPEKGGFHNINSTEDSKSTDQTIRSRSATFDSKDKVGNLPAKKGTNGRAGAKGVQRTFSSVTFGDEASRNRSSLVDKLNKKLSEGERGGFSRQDSTSSDPGKGIQEAEALNRMKVHELVIEAPTYQSYQVKITSRMRASTNVMLGISGERIEIDPLHGYSNKFWHRMKSVSYNMDSVAGCEITENKTNRTTFTLVYASNRPSNHSQEPSPSMGMHNNQPSNQQKFKRHEFECDHFKAKEIVEKINRILELQSSVCRRQYRAEKERRLNKSLLK